MNWYKESMQTPYYIAVKTEGRLKGMYPAGIEHVPSMKRQWDKGGLGSGKKMTEARGQNLEELLQDMNRKGIERQDMDVEYYVVNHGRRRIRREELYRQNPR